ncbi:MAG: lysoplasmalogenase [Saprospiraceae bacterium]|nr:lysoplasmalogenase [Saprospiraceae bacterium]
MINLTKYMGFSIFYGIVFFFNILCLYYITDYIVVAKPMIMASLIGFYIGVEKRQSHALILAMIFALFGDVFLLFKDDIFFRIGLFCFLVMQILYTFVFVNDRSGNTKKLIKTALCIFLITGIFLVYIWNGLGDLRIPVLVYSIAISVMVISALNRRNTFPGYRAVVTGVLLFMISDTILAISKFGSPFPLQHVLVISSYVAAQFLIVRGVVAGHENSV